MELDKEVELELEKESELELEQCANSTIYAPM